MTETILANAMLVLPNEVIHGAIRVQDGQIAAIDAVTWDMIVQWDGFAHGLKVVGRTQPTPGLPYVAALGSDADLLFEIMSEAIASLPETDRAILRLKGFNVVGSMES